jgi:hypothetical protein
MPARCPFSLAMINQTRGVGHSQGLRPVVGCRGTAEIQFNQVSCFVWAFLLGQGSLVRVWCLSEFRIMMVYPLISMPLLVSLIS